MAARHAYTIKKILSGQHLYNNTASEWSFVRVLVTNIEDNTEYETVVSCQEFLAKDFNVGVDYAYLDIFDPLKFTNGDMCQWIYIGQSNSCLTEVIEKTLINSHVFLCDRDLWSKRVMINRETLEIMHFEQID